MRDKKQERLKRTRYIRELEKFLRRTLSLVADETLTLDQFAKRIRDFDETLRQTEKIFLGSGYLNELEKLIETIRELPDSDLSLEEIKGAIIRGANKLEQTKSRFSYKREKHKKESWDEW